MSQLKPRRSVPDLSVSLLDGGSWTLAQRAPANFTLVVFYRGLHCPICRPYLRDLDRKVTELAERGVEAVAISGDVEERARRAREEWGLRKVQLGYGLEMDTAREWGLFISSSRGLTSVGIEEPALFAEPGVFLVRPDALLYGSMVQTMPFARPHFDEIVQALDFILAKDYPARGEA